MTTTFLDLLRSEVAKFQALHPERTGEIARAHALILHGQVLPSADDPETGMVLSSDGEKIYHVNGTCDCTAGQHGKPCKHMQSWKLYRHIQKQHAALLPQAPVVEAEPLAAPTPPVGPLPEAPVSITLRATLHGHEVLVTLRGHDFASVQAQVEQASTWLRSQAPAAPPDEAHGQEWCAVHAVLMRLNRGKGGKSDWFSHKAPDGSWCKGKRGAR